MRACLRVLYCVRTEAPSDNQTECECECVRVCVCLLRVRQPMAWISGARSGSLASAYSESAFSLLSTHPSTSPPFCLCNGLLLYLPASVFLSLILLNILLLVFIPVYLIFKIFFFPRNMCVWKQWGLRYPLSCFTQCFSSLLSISSFSLCNFSSQTHVSFCLPPHRHLFAHILYPRLV